MNPAQELFNFIPYSNTLQKVLLYFIGSAVLGFIIAPIIIKMLYKLNIRRVSKGDIVSQQFDEAKGKIGTPIMGGLIVIITVVAISVFFNWERGYTWLPIGALLLSCSIGGIDDLLNIFGEVRSQPKPLRLHLKLMLVHKSPLKRFYYFLTVPWALFKRLLLFMGSRPNAGLQVHEKILLQAFIGVTVGYWIYYLVNWNTIWIPYIAHAGVLTDFLNSIGMTVYPQTSSVYVGWLMIPFITLTIITVTNAVNFSDGMDGLAGGLLLIAFAAYTIIAFNISQDPRVLNHEGFRHIAYLCATVGGALLAYLYFNVKPARVQMSDVGSLALGTLLSIIAVVLHKEFTLIFISAVILFDGLWSRIIQSIYRRFTGKKLFKIVPIHYHFEMKGWPEEKVVIRFWIVAGLFAAIGIWVAGL